MASGCAGTRTPVTTTVSPHYVPGHRPPAN